MSYERVRKFAGVVVALMAFAIWASVTPAIASPPTGPGTPSVFTNKIAQPIGIAADQNRILVTHPYCFGVPFSSGTAAVKIETLDSTGTPAATPYATIPEPYDSAALQGLVTFTVGLNGMSDETSANCAEVDIVISTFSAFGTGAVYAAFGGHIYKIVGSPAVVTQVADITSIDGTNAHTDLAFDLPGLFNHNLIVTGTNDATLASEVWMLDSSFNKTLLASIPSSSSGCTGGNAFNGCIEGADFIPAAGLSGLYGGSAVAELVISQQLAVIAPTTFAVTLLNNLNGTAPYTGESVRAVPSTLCTAAPGGVDTGLTFFDVNFGVFSEATGNPINADCASIGAAQTIYGYPSSNFAGLAGQLMQNPEANGVGDSGYLISTGAANATNAIGAVFDPSCYETEGMTFVTCVPNVCKDTTLTWGYWKTHTGSGAPKQDPTYLKLSTTCPAVGGVGAISLDGDCDNGSDLFAPTVITCAKKATCGAQSADALFAGGNGGKVNCSGKCVTLFAAQLLAAELNVVGNPALGGAIYTNPANPSDPFNGMTLGAILTALQTAFDVYVDGGAISCGGQTGSFTACQNTLDAINNSSESTHTLNCGSPSVAGVPGPGGPAPGPVGGNKHKHKHNG